MPGRWLPGRGCCVCGTSVRLQCCASRRKQSRTRRFQAATHSSRRFHLKEDHHKTGLASSQREKQDPFRIEKQITPCRTKQLLNHSKRGYQQNKYDCRNCSKPNNLRFADNRIPFGTLSSGHTTRKHINDRQKNYCLCNPHPPWKAQFIHGNSRSSSN